MKLLTFTVGESEKVCLGALVGDNVLDLNVASEGEIPPDMLTFIEGGNRLLSLAKEIVVKPKQSAVHSIKNIKIKTPLANPPSLKDFFAFEEHAKAGAKRRNEILPDEWYEIPAYYKGNHREIYGPDDEIPWPSYTRKLDFECEIACVIGKKGKNLSEKEACDYIFGYMIFNDFSARDIQKKEMILRMGPTKGKDFANAFGPYIVTSDEVDPKVDFSMKIKVNGEFWSEGHFKDQYWGFPLMVSYVSCEETIYPGDIFGSGTFYKGCGLDLDRWLKPQDTIELEVPALGMLRNKIGRPREQKELNYRKSEVRAER